MSPQWKDNSWAWIAVCLLLALPSLALPIISIDSPSLWPDHVEQLVLHPNRGWHQHIASWWSAAWLHGSTEHLIKNLLGCAVVGIMGFVCKIPTRFSAAWFCSWPLTQMGMLGRPELSTYIGMSGVLHAGIALIALYQILPPAQNNTRRLGWILLIGATIKILMENPWGQVLILSSSSAINVAPWAHFSGLVTGLACGVSAFLWKVSQSPQFKRP